MKKIIFCITVLLTSLQIWAQSVTINESSGWLESAFVKWAPVSGADSYNVYYTGGGQTNKKIDTQLIRSYGNYFRADIPGLAAGSYTVKVTPVISGTEGSGTTTGSLTVLAQDRSGFAFSNARVPGAYKANGTPKDNAVILYITEKTKNTISMDITGASTNPCVGIQNILYAIKKGKDTRPFIIRLIGNITDASVLDGGDIVIENANNASSYVTLEGIGNDAVANGWGIRIKNASNIEVRNIGLMLTNASEGDNIGLQQNNDYIWVHNCDLFYGVAGGDADQAKGDGAMDCKKSTYITFSYNHFWDSGKCNLLGLSEGTTSGLYITYHHNWYDHSDSRHPRIRYYSAHVYNNYYDGNSKYGAGSTLGSSVFMEGNFFRNCKYPMLTSMQGTDVYNGAEGTFSGEAGGTIKAYNNTMSGQTRFVAYHATNYPKEFDAYVATTRNETISSSITSKVGSNTYNNFDTNSAIMYAYTADSPEVAKDKTMLYAGRVSGGDLKWTFNNAVDDTADGVNTALKAALTSYTTKLVSIQGETISVNTQTITSTSNSSQTVASGTAIASIVFTWGGSATDASVTGLPAGLSSVKNSTAKTITISGIPTATGTYTVATSGTSGSSASGSGTITVTAASVQTLTSTSNNSQTVTSGTAIGSIVFTWGGSATDATVTGLPAGLSSVKNSTAKTITISGTPTATGTYTVTTSGTGTAATGSGTITVTATSVQTLTSPSNKSQTVTSGTAIGSIVFTWGGSATDATVAGLPAGLSSAKNSTAKTITISGTPTATGTYTVTTSGTGTAAIGSGTITVTAASVQTLTSPSNKSQTVTSGTAIGSIVFTWGGSATDATVTGLPAGLSSAKNATAKTITISGTPTATGTYTVTTSGTGTAVTGSGTITVNTATQADQIHNFTVSGKTSSFYAITGNMNSTPGSVTYAGLTLTARLKIETSTSIKFTTTAASTLTLVFDSTFAGTIFVNSVSYTASAGIVTVSLPAGVNTITKGSVANLYYIRTKYNTTARISQKVEVAENTEASKLILYPNPATDQLNISSSDLKVEKVLVYSLTGSLVKSVENNTESIDISNLVAGSYLVKVETAQGISTEKIIIKK